GSAVYTFSMATPCNTSSSGGAYLDDRVGYMKISNQGTHLVLARRQSTSVNEIFTFDNSTGQVTSNLGTYYTGALYGVEFSQNGNYFYTTNFTNVVQYDIATLTPTTLHTASGNNVGALQMGPDGNIYVANGYEGVNNSNLDMISNVNTYPATYNNNYISLPSSPTATYSRLGLPDFVACFVPTYQGCEVESNFHWAFDPATCSYQFTDMSTFGSGTQIVSWLWKFGDGTSSTEQNPVHHYTNPGNYIVCLTVTGYDGEECCVSEICLDVNVDGCEEECNVDPDFDWELDECENCQHNFNGFTHFSNREIIAWIWDFGDGNTGTGQNPSHTYGGPGVYMVCLTVIARNNADDQQCCVFKICHPVNVDCKGDPDGEEPPHDRTAPHNEDEQAPSQTLRAYPNPASATLHVEYTVPSEQKVSVQMIDYTGKIIWEDSKTASKGMVKRDIDISAAKAGIYLLVVNGETFNMVEKIQIVKY
ncbi:MAG TPA: PKD domain-containing protein, partial [Bacteroidia bacterium]|nr:PKD domain-containing protein [Bacteroidia bacterium]